MPRRKTDVHIRLSIALLAAIVELVAAENSVAQTTVYTVSEVSAASGQVACRINNLGDLVGRAGDSVGGGTGAAMWGHGALHVHAGRLNSPGIHCDVLGRGPEGDKYRPARDPQYSRLRIAPRQIQQTDGNPGLREPGRVPG